MPTNHTTYENLTNDQINALRTAALQVGDTDTVTTCDDALGGSQTARAECARAIQRTEVPAPKYITLFVLNQALAAIRADETVPGESTGVPSYGGRAIEAIESGMVPRKVTWSSDRGNWMWDGALVTLRVLGIDPDKPV